ncbi:3-phosphoshikimate 1-carboxyvinyltransferase [Flavicella sediminum]|uniref:3-phosphoshikimate 1-carboxyvinyltransferase n=1 Tax=Flavicella sediminum TaxID=2585141 RepID=UPI0011238D08|nr:3-phosphoshikimate 1-carboxyvinyltransferase [Flavicella sediminum]
MSTLKLNHFTGEVQQEIKITGSKSESNRLLILQQLYPNLDILNLSNSDDSNLMLKALANKGEEINIGHAGTTMRFLTSLLSTKVGSDVILTGSGRMKERPIGILVDALRTLGADISYIENDGFAPLRIKGTKLAGGKVRINGNVSSQYVSSILLIAPSLENGIELEFEGAITSIPYIQMTLGLLNTLGVQTSFEGQLIKVAPKATIEDTTITVESDWSSASYYYSLVAMSANGKIELSAYKKESLQGDSVLAEIYKSFGVKTTFLTNTILLEKIEGFKNPEHVSFDLIKAPDIAQTIAVTCFGMGISCDLSGLHTLKIKETDRLVALQNELTKLGAEISVTDETLHLKAAIKINSEVSIATYQDHRMAMAFAPLLLKTTILIEESDVVSKSYPTFWEDFAKFQ